jgi:hypothetical protein
VSAGRANLINTFSSTTGVLLSEDRAALSFLPKSERTMVLGERAGSFRSASIRAYQLTELQSAMPGSDSEDDIDDFDNEGDEDIEQEIFDAIEAGAEEATEGDPVCSFKCSGK